MQKTSPPQLSFCQEKGAKRIIFCTYPSVYSDSVLDELLQEEGIEVVGVMLSTRVLHKNYNHFYASWQQIRRSGFLYAVYLFVVTDLYRVLRGVLGWPLGKFTLQQRLKKQGIPVLETRDINDDNGLVFIAGLSADVMLSAHFNQLVGEKILNLKHLACLNIHPSLLPAYKGVDPAFYALLRGETVTGVTVHFQDMAFDTGRILAQQPLDIEPSDSLLGLNLKLFRLGALNAIRQIVGLTASREGIQQVEGGQYDSWPDAQHVRVFRRTRRLFRWREVFSTLR